MLGRTGIACVVVALALVASAHGDSLSSYKKQVAGGPAAQAIGMAIDALEAGDLKRAEVASWKALTLAPDEPHALALLAEAEMRQGHQANALKYLQTAVAKNPKSAVAQEAMGRYLDENKEYAGAESAFKKAMELHPKWAAAGRLLLSGAGPICARIDSVSSCSCRGSKEWSGASGVGLGHCRCWGRAKLREGVTNGCQPDAKLGSAACGIREPAIAEGAG